MKITKLIPLVIIPFLVSCSNTYEEEETVKTSNNKTSTTAVTTKVDTANTTVTNKVNVTPTKTTSAKVNHQVTKSHEFSKPGKKDLFSISLTGKTILDGDVVFKIVAYNNKTIYEDKFKANFLVGNGPPESYAKPMTVKQQEDYIIKRMNEFFAEKNFKKPAITMETLDTYNISKAIWDDIKADKSSIGFIYTIGKENTKHIAYHKKSGKAVMYFNCC